MSAPHSTHLGSSQRWAEADIVILIPKKGKATVLKNRGEEKLEAVLYPNKSGDTYLTLTQSK